jgi:hypothetical protein
LAWSGHRLSFEKAGIARVWTWNGRLLWEGRGAAGESRDLPPGAALALRAFRARLEFNPH